MRRTGARCTEPLRGVRSGNAAQHHVLRALCVAVGRAGAVVRALHQTRAAVGFGVPFRYEWPLAQLESRFKFGADLAAGRTLSLL